MTVSTMAKLLDAAPVVADAFARDTRFPSPVVEQRVFNKAIGGTERYNGSAWVPEFRSALPSSGTLVRAVPYVAVASGTANFGPTTGQAALEFVNVMHRHRVRQNGTVTRVSFYLAATTAITGLYIRVWRLNGTTYDLVGTSANLVASLTAPAINTISLTAGLAVQEGDYVGMRVEYSSASAQNFFASTIANTTLGQIGGTIYSVLNATPTATGYDWAAQTATASRGVLIGLDMAAPVFVTIGDSITSGLPASGSYADNYTTTSDISNAYAYSVGHALGYTYQNVGIGSETVANMAARFAADVVALAPRLVILMGGVNDILASTSNATILTSVTAMLTAAKAAGIVPIIIGVTPFRSYTTATTGMLQQRDLLNASLQTLVTNSTYRGYYINPDAYLGQHYLGGDAGNLWRLGVQYDSGDGLHPNASGKAALAQGVLDAIGPLGVQLAGSSGGLTALTQLSGKIGVGNTSPTALLTVGQANTNPNASVYAFGYGYVKTDTTARRGGTLVQSSESSNPFILYTEVIGAAAVAGRRVNFQTADELLANDGILTLQQRGGTVWLGNVGANPNGNPVMIGYPFSKTDTTSRRAVGLAASNDSTNPFVLYVSMTGAATQATRVVAVQTGEEGIANGGILALQAAGGPIGVGTLAPSGAKVHIVNGGTRTTDFASAVLKLYSDLTKGIWGGYDNVNNYGLLGAIREGVAHDPLHLAPLGGGIGVGLGTPLTKIVVYTPTLTPASVAAATVAEQTFTVTGLTTADKVEVNPPAIANATGIAGCRVSAADTLAIRFVNPTAGALTPTSGVFNVIATRS